jgi:(E)-4-hydroxy-3-methylbut-2-enyl-diphosphate synthase
VNHGSLSDRIMSRYGDTPEGMVESCMEFLRICKETGFEDVVISIKASNTVMMVRTVRLLVDVMHAEGMLYPLHLGVTEAGDDEDGRIKSAVGIGALLIDGIGDTIRVSLSEPPEAELPVARKIVDYILERSPHPIENTLPTPPVISTETHEASAEGVQWRIENRPKPNLQLLKHPVVISDRRAGDLTIDPLNIPDYLYAGSTTCYPTDNMLLIDIDHWHNRPNAYPYFYNKDIGKLKTTISDLKFLELTCPEPDDTLLKILRNDPTIIVVLNYELHYTVDATRLFASRLKAAGCDVPVILRCDYRETDPESLQIKAAVDFGSLLIDGIGDGLFLCNEMSEACLTDRTMFSILQATRRRISKTEYISCPGCGRTLFDLHTTIARVKAATAHMTGLKIGIMGCIVNGPGEMADADYGYVGAGRGRISLYKGKTCVLKNIPEEEAVEQLINLIEFQLF